MTGKIMRDVAGLCVMGLCLSQAVAEDIPSNLVPSRVMTELRAAQVTRAKQREEEQAWRLEQERLALLRDTIRREAKRLDEAAAEDEATRTTLERRADTRDERQDRAAVARAMLGRAADRVEAALQRVAGRAPPGVVPPKAKRADQRPDARFFAAMNRLEQAEQRVQSAGVELVNATWENQMVTVRLLRLGGVAAWWVSLDAERGGIARMKDGGLVLSAGSPEDVRAILRALDMIEGRAAPDWVVLPVEPMEAP